MKRKLTALMIALLTTTVVACGNNGGSNAGEQTQAPAASSGSEASKELKGEIVLWHSFTQGPRNDFMKQAADDFMAAHPGVKITIETFAWSEFYTKWTTGLMSGQVPDISTALPNHVVEMLDADAIIPLDDVIDNVGRDRFYEAPLKEGTLDGKIYSIPLYSHAQVMWYRKDLLEKAGLQVPENLGRAERGGGEIEQPAGRIRPIRTYGKWRHAGHAFLELLCPLRRNADNEGRKGEPDEPSGY